jgi:hypothetical protein
MQFGDLPGRIVRPQYKKGEPMRRGWLAGLVVVALLGAACGDDDDGDAAPTSGPVTIETQITFSATEAFSGTFEVAEGADVLGCSSGSFVDDGRVEVEGGELFEITKVLTCESGPKVGTISVLFIPGQDVDDSERETGPWVGTEGTGDFEGLGGGGDFEVVYDSETTGVETFTGTVEFGP